MGYLERMNDEDIFELINELKQAAQAYYQGGETLMTDEVYDIKFNTLSHQLEILDQDLEVGDPQLIEAIESVLYTVSANSEPESNIVHHDYPMLSLAKADNYDSLKRYHERLVKGGAKGFSVQMKLDGLAMSAKYNNGKLIQLATRGDGEKGESLNHLINHKEVEIKGLPETIDSLESLEVRGELYISENQFVKINRERFTITGENFSHSRNAVVGITKRSASGLEYNAEISFSVYSAHKSGKQIVLRDIDNSFSKINNLTLKELQRVSKLESCVISTNNFEGLDKLVQNIGELRSSLDIPTDGVVIKPLNDLEMLEKMGYTSKFPIAYIAYKYPGEKALAVIEDIIVSVGKTGRLTPQAKITPVTIDGVTISNVTCHNYSWMNEMGIRKGAKVAVTRANDVIPAIDVVIDKGSDDVIQTPTECPECSGKLKGDGTKYPKTLSCTNDDCPSKLLFYMMSIVGRNYLHIDGLGGVSMKALVDNKVLTSIVDLFNLTEDKLKDVPTGETSSGNIRTLGAGNAKNIMKSIENAKKGTDSNKLLASFNIEGVGPGTAKRLIKHFGGIEKVLSVKPERLLEVDQVGSKLMKSFENKGNKALLQLENLVKIGVKVNDPLENESRVEFKGTFSVSGSVEGFNSRIEFVEYMENNGWFFHKTPKKDTVVLFADPESTSSKVKKAKANGTRIINNLRDL